MIVDNRLIQNLPDDRVYITASGLNKTLKQAIIDGNLGSGGGGSTTPLEIFNTTVTIATSAATATGLIHFRSPAAETITLVVVQLFDKGGISSGTLEIDIKKNTSPDDVGMTTIFSTKPSFNFATAPAFSTSSGTLSTTSLATGDYLRLDITSIPSGFRGSVQVMVYA